MEQEQKDLISPELVRQAKAGDQTAFTEVYSSQLRDGTAYLFAGNVTLILDQDRDCGPLVSDCSMTI